MTVSIVIFADGIKIYEWTDRGNDVISFKVRVRRPGESFAGRPYEYWRRLGQQLGRGRHEVPDEESPLTVEEFLKAPIPDRPVEDRLPEDWQKLGSGERED
jgi:hypothetical protein